MNPSFWRDKRVLVTGHTGFKGSWLCLWLQLAGARVYGYSLPPPTRNNLFEAARVGAGMDDRQGDVRDVAALVAACEAAAPEIVFHLAAQALVRRSYEDPLETLSTNVLGTANVLEAVRRTGHARAVVVVTSDKCYENREWHWSYREKSALGGRDPYSTSKACAELVAKTFRESFFSGMTDGQRVLVATARAGNVIGGGDWAHDRIVPDAIRALTSGGQLALRFPGSTRPWQHVLEPLSGYVELAERLASGDASCAEAWNFAPSDDEARPVGWLVERLYAEWGSALDWVPQEGQQPHESTYLKLDASKARARLGWRPRLGIDETVQWVVDWYRRDAAGEDPRALTEQQIRRYQELG